MEKVTSFFKNKYVIGFGVGFAAAFIGYKAYKSKKVRKAVVKILARGMKLRDEARFAVSSIKEEAEDLCAETKEESAGGKAD
ncbi:MAG: hypothetical protein LBB22_05215 [Treponema sp.]|jgi:hypothetical protein|nr:hypothetical protein [Treponema sp.]